MLELDENVNEAIEDLYDEDVMLPELDDLFDDLGIIT